MLASKIETFRLSLSGKTASELAEVAVAMFIEKEEIACRLAEFQNSTTEMSLQFQQMKVELEAAKKQVKDLLEQNRHLADLNNMRANDLYGRSTEKASAIFSQMDGDTGLADPVDEDAVEETGAGTEPDSDGVPTGCTGNGTGQSGIGSEEEGKKGKGEEREKEEEKGPGDSGNGGDGKKGKEGKEGGGGRKPKQKRDFSNLPHVTDYAINFEELDSLYGEGNWRIAFWEEHTQLEIVRQAYIRTVYTPVISTGLEHVLERPVPWIPVIPKSIASASLLASIAKDKFGMYLPLYRQEYDPDRFGIPVSRQTMSNWLSYAARELFMPVYLYLVECLQLHIIYQQCDETPYMVVLDGRGAGSKSYVWIHRTSELLEGNAIIVYCYEKTRGTDHLRRFYAGRTEPLFLTSDAYCAYPLFAEESGGLVTSCGCFAHSRRRFVVATQLLDACGLGPGQLGELTEAKALDLIKEAYQAEGKLKGCTADERKEKREGEVCPKVDSLFDFIKAIDLESPLVSEKLKDAIQYSINQEGPLREFLGDGNIPIDNNACERSVKPVAQVRKNSLFSNTIGGAECNMVYHTLIETAKANQADAGIYLKYLLEKMAENLYWGKAPRMECLMPWSEDYRAYELSEKRRVQEYAVPPGSPKPKTPRKKEGKAEAA